MQQFNTIGRSSIFWNDIEGIYTLIINWNRNKEPELEKKNGPFFGFFR
jgi:hypothetical protein